MSDNPYTQLARLLARQAVRDYHNELTPGALPGDQRAVSHNTRSRHAWHPLNTSPAGTDRLAPVTGHPNSTDTKP